MLRIFLVLAGLLITAHPLAASSPGDADGLFVVQAVDNLWNCAGERIEQNVFNGVVTDTILFYQHIIDTVKYWSYLNDLPNPDRIQVGDTIYTYSSKKQREKLLEEQGFNLVSAPFHKTLREFAAEQYISLNTLTKLVPYINPDDKLNHRLIPVPVNIERAHEIVQHEIDTTHEVTPDTTETIEGFTTLFAVDITDSKVDTFQEDSTLLTEKTETIEDSTLLAADITESKAETVQEDSMLLAGNIYSGKNPEPSLFSSFLNLIQDNVLEGTKFDITLVPTIPSRIVEDIKGRWEWIINPGYRYRLIYLICLAACLIGILIWIRYRDYKVSIYFYTYSADTIPKKDMWKYRLHRCGVYLTIGPPCLAVLMKLII